MSTWSDLRDGAGRVVGRWQRDGAIAVVELTGSRGIATFRFVRLANETRIKEVDVEGPVDAGMKVEARRVAERITQGDRRRFARARRAA